MKRDKLYDYADGSRFSGMSAKETFLKIAEANIWGDGESVSGHGASLEQTRNLVLELPELFRKLSVKTVLDLPCGDFNWMREVTTQLETEIDFIEADLIVTAKFLKTPRFAWPNVEFRELNLLCDDFPPAELILCRDCLVHFSLSDVQQALRNIKRSGATYLITTTFNDEPTNKDIITGGWRPLNFLLEPFNWPLPLELIMEDCTEMDGAFSDKSLGVWRITDL